jgi:hypothetical protein
MDRHEIDLVTERLLKRFAVEALVGWGFAAFLPNIDLMERIDETFAEIRADFELSDEDLLSLHGDEILQGADIVSNVSDAVLQAEIVRKHTTTFVERYLRENWREHAKEGMKALGKAAVRTGACSGYTIECRSLALRKLATG